MVVMQGPLLKWTNVVKGYQQRWFVLDEINGLLSYYTSAEKMIRGDRRGCIRLKDAILGIEDEDDTTFYITSDNKTFHCKALSAKERDNWINCLTDLIHQLNKQRQQRLKYTLQKVPTIDEFNKKLTETDSYLRILIQYSRKLDTKIEDVSCEFEKKKLIALKERASYFLDSIKHTIVLLQISKNIKYPVDGIFLNLNDTEGREISEESIKLKQNKQTDRDVPVNDLAASTSNEGHQSIGDKNVTFPSTIEPTGDGAGISSPLTVGAEISTDLDVVECSSEVFQQTFPNIDSKKSILEENRNNLNQKLKSSEIPDISYASSDDEDCFFDANDQSDSEDSSSMKSVKHKSAMPVSKPLKTDSTGEIDYDKLYESDDDNDGIGSISAHGSVISHLLAQVKIGMDLTKVALPTFILERRSLLEMYADFFAHADIFVSIPDYPTPRERMIQVTKWYLSAFHAARKGSIAKKPYNPILGEVFKCYWNLSKDSTKNDNGGDQESCKDSPVPWAKPSDLIFVAEQVSHHPPISAFYAECPEKRIMCCAQIWTKSKFLGLSIGVNNLGQGSIYLLDHGEEYVCTFPSAYGRSILTEPWFEMGGSVQIDCRTTGYSAKIDFLTKPFYGGKKHRITAEVFDPNKKTLVNITGEWNGKIEAKWASTGKTELFIDTKSMPIIKKQVKPIAEQEEYESRNLWKRVTLALRKQDVNEASTAKYHIEQRQRDLVKEREEKAIKWQNRLFHNLGDKWAYNNPLTSRKPNR